jgi:hypothetical protein
MWFVAKVAKTFGKSENPKLVASFATEDDYSKKTKAPAKIAINRPQAGARHSQTTEG